MKNLHGFSRTPEYHAWKDMLYRCYNEKHKKYKRYGGRGITVCDRWHHKKDDNALKNFLADMKERPEGYSLDRINNNGNYEPENCRWATSSQQARNRRNNYNFELGEKFGDYVVIESKPIYKKNNAHFKCRCACGIEKEVFAGNLKSEGRACCWACAIKKRWAKRKEDNSQQSKGNNVQ